MKLRKEVKQCLDEQAARYKDWKYPLEKHARIIDLQRRAKEKGVELTLIECRKIVDEFL